MLWLCAIFSSSCPRRCLEAPSGEAGALRMPLSGLAAHQEWELHGKRVVLPVVSVVQLAPPQTNWVGVPECGCLALQALSTLGQVIPLANLTPAISRTVGIAKAELSVVSMRIQADVRQKLQLLGLPLASASATTPLHYCWPSSWGFHLSLTKLITNSCCIISKLLLSSLSRCVYSVCCLLPLLFSSWAGKGEFVAPKHPSPHSLAGPAWVMDGINTTGEMETLSRPRQLLLSAEWPWSGLRRRGWQCQAFRAGCALWSLPHPGLPQLPKPLRCLGAPPEQPK